MTDEQDGRGVGTKNAVADEPPRRGDGSGNDDDGHDGNDPEFANSDIILPHLLLCRRRSSSRPRPRLNHNVALTLLLSVLYGLSDSLWSGTVMAAFLKRLGHDRNGPVGDVEAVSGLAALLSALPVGYLADKVGRARVVAAGGVLILLTSVLHAALLGWIGTDERALDDDARKRTAALYLLAGIMALWGVGGGVINGPSQALYADSTPNGKRSVYYVWLFACYMLSSCLGPLVSIVLFRTLGDEWDLRHLRMVLYVGLGLEALSAFVMFFFDDNKALDEGGDCGGGESEGEEVAETRGDGGRQEGDEGAVDAFVGGDGEAHSSINGARVPSTDEEAGSLKGRDGMASGLDDNIALIEPLLNGNSDEGIGQYNDGGAQARSSNGDNNVDRLKQRRKLIPIILCSQSCIFAVGSGMTVKFFPLFFKEEVGMTPSHVQVIYVIVPVAMVLLSGVAEKIASTGFGRVQSMIVLNTLGVSALFAMVFAKAYLDVHPLVLVPVYVLRTALMNCTYPLNESILMDYVPKNERARWKSLDSVASFGWCGSAAVGGWLTDRYDYTYTFFITAIIQSVGVLAIVPLIPLVPRKETDVVTMNLENRSEDRN